MAWTRLALAGVALMAAACESSAKETREPVAPVVTTMDDATPPALARPAKVDPPLIDVTREEMYVGRLIANERLSVMKPSEYCLEDGRLYQGALFRLGSLNVFGLDQVLGAMQVKGPIALIADQRPSLFSRTKERGPCPEPYEPIQVQMRSDWIPPEGGPRTTRALLEGLSYLEARSATPVHMFAPLDSDEDLVRVRIRNPFTLSLATLTFTAHYEGGPGKPMPTYLAKELALEPGEWGQIELPRRLGGEQPRTKAGSDLRSIDLHGQLGKATLAIELFVPRS